MYDSFWFIWFWSHFTFQKCTQFLSTFIPKILSDSTVMLNSTLLNKQIHRKIPWKQSQLALYFFSIKYFEKLHVISGWPWGYRGGEFQSYDASYLLWFAENVLHWIQNISETISSAPEYSMGFQEYHPLLYPIYHGMWRIVQVDGLVCQTI